MANLEKLRDLETWLVEANGANRGLDACIHARLIPCDKPDCMWWPNFEGDWGKVFYLPPSGSMANADRIIAPEYTASLDLALALIEEKLPGWVVSIHFGNSTGWPNGAQLNRIVYGDISDNPDDEILINEATTAALAACLALVRALIAMEESQPVQEGESGEKEG